MSTQGRRFLPSETVSNSEPPPQEICPIGQAQFLGDQDCSPIGPSCPTGPFPVDAAIRAAAPGFTGSILYVEPGGTGDGTATAPFGSLEIATDASAHGDIIALAKGLYSQVLSIHRAIAVVGARVARTIIRAPTPRDDLATAEFVGSSGTALLTQVWITGDRPGLIVAPFGVSPVLRTGELSCNEVPIPTQDRLRFHDGGDALRARDKTSRSRWPHYAAAARGFTV